jgi:hypothetical protein
VILHLPCGRSIPCDPASPIVAFDGGDPVDCEVSGPAKALNLIVRPAEVAAGLERFTPQDCFETVGRRAGGGRHDGRSAGPLLSSGARPGGATTIVFVQSGDVECRRQPQTGEAGGECKGGEGGTVLRALGWDSVVVPERSCAGGDVQLRAAGGRSAVVLLASIAPAAAAPGHVPG